MSIKYVKHDRPVTDEQIKLHGKLATHDIEVPITLLYELGKTKDGNGTPIDVNAKFMHSTMEATNNFITKRHSSIFAKAKSYFQHDINRYEQIPIIKNHNTNDVDGTCGYSQGLCYIETIKDKETGKKEQQLVINSVIRDLNAKIKLIDRTFRNTSLGTRGDGSIKEISVVINEALPHCGFQMGENLPNEKHIINETADLTNDKSCKLSEQEIQLKEQIQEIQLQKHQLKYKTIPNHMILMRMLKTGKIEYYKYQDLILQETSTLQLLEHALPSYDIGGMLGTCTTPHSINHDSSVNYKEIINNVLEKHPTLQKSLKTDTKKTTPITDDIISQSYNLEEQRKKELKHIRELITYSPDIANDYISIELGEKIVKDNNDITLSEYIAQENEFNEQLNNLQIQLKEHSV